MRIICRHCGTVTISNKRYVQYYCNIECRKKYNIQTERERNAYVKKNNPALYQSIVEKKRLSREKWLEKNPDYYKEWDEKRQARLSAAFRVFKEIDGPKTTKENSKYTKAYYYRNRESSVNRSRKWSKRNPEKHAENSRRCRAKRKAAVNAFREFGIL